MIPDHLVDKAAAAIYASTVFGDQFAIDAWRDMDDNNPAKTTTRMYAHAALNATAADIWDEGEASVGITMEEWEVGRTFESNPYRGLEKA